MGGGHLELLKCDLDQRGEKNTSVHSAAKDHRVVGVEVVGEGALSPIHRKRVAEEQGT